MCVCVCVCVCVRECVCVIIKTNDEKYRKVVYKSRGLCAIFQLFGVASIYVRLLLDGGLYAKSWNCKTDKSVPTCSVTSRIHFDRQLACRHSEVRPRCPWQRALYHVYLSLPMAAGSITFLSARLAHACTTGKKKKEKRRTDREAEAERKSTFQRKIMHENK